MRITYYLEIFSSWCHYVEPVWDELQRRYAGRVAFEWRIAWMREEDFPDSREQCDWYYRRSGGTVMHWPRMLNSGWVEPGRPGGYCAPGLVAEAGRGLGAGDDRIRRALAEAALLQGKRIADLDLAVRIGAKAAAIPPARLLKAARSEATRERVAQSTRDFLAHGISQRPGFILESAIGDKAVFSGLVRIEPLAATIDAMLADASAYAAHAAHHPPPPA